MKKLLTLTLLAVAMLGMVACQKVDEAAAAAKVKMDEMEAWNGKLKAVTEATAKANAARSAEAIANLYADDAVEKSANDPTGAMSAKGKKAIMDRYAGYFKAFPDMKVEVISTAYTSEGIIQEAVISGTNTGPMMGPDGKEMKPTQKPFKIQMVSAMKVNKEGKITEETTYWDNMAFMQQMGMMK